MPQINRDEFVCDLQEYLPPENSLSDARLEGLSENIIQNQIPEDDEEYYSEALCKALKVASIMNHMNHTVGGSSLKVEQAGEVRYEYSDENQRNIWKQFENSLPSICPYLPKGGYNMPTTIGVLVKKGEEIKITSCDDTCNLIL